jgi:hypothetical protein
MFVRAFLGLQGHQYFTCPEYHGLLLRPFKVHRADSTGGEHRW